MSFCKCADGQQNLGVLSCPRLLQSVKKHIRVAKFDDNGVRNSIKLSDLVDGKLTDAFILGKLTESDASAKWYLTPKTYENVEPSRTDSSFEDFSSGAKVKVDTGVKEFMGIIPMIDAQIAAKMNAGACSSFGHYEIDSEGSIKGELSADGLELYPIAVASGSFEAVEIEAVEGSAVQRVQVSFQYAKTVNEANLRIVSSEDILVELLSINGALDGDLAGTGTPSATEFSVTFSIADYGYFGETIAIEGQTEPADWLIVDSGLNVIVPSAVAEVTEGQYDFTIASTPAETLSVSFVGVPDSALDQVYESSVVTITTP
jgi:hypothetical protein